MRLACVFLLLAIVPTAPAQQRETDADRAAKLVTRWRIIMRVEYENTKAINTEALDALADGFLSDGAVTATRDHASERQLQDADASVRRFVAAMVKAGHRDSDGTTTLDEPEFEAARRAMCPIYPFCR